MKLTEKDKAWPLGEWDGDGWADFCSSVQAQHGKGAIKDTLMHCTMSKYRQQL